MRHTRAACRRVLAVAHTVTSTVRLLEALELLHGDDRVEVFFTEIDGASFPRGVTRLIEEVDGLLIPWRDAARAPFHLAVATGSSGPLHQLNAPLLSLAHGLGYNKLLVPDGQAKPDPQGEAYGLARRQLLHDGAVVPSLLGVSHSEQIGRLKQDCPEAADRALLVGDLSFDRLTASLPWRDAYRAALGVAEHQTLVVVSSTWGSSSLLDEHPKLPLELLRQLPSDEFRIALVVHPNVTARHGGWNLRSWYADAVRAGLIVIPRRAGWHGAVVAADLIVGDHGSVTLYGACLDRPVLLAGFDAAAIVPDTAMARLGATSSRLDPRRPLRPQLDRVRRHGHLRADAVETPGAAASAVRAAMYRLMDLPEPGTPAYSTAAPVTSPEDGPGVTARLVTGELVDGACRVERFPVSADVADPQLVVEDTEPNPGIVGLAESLVRRGHGPTSALPPDAVFARHPGCRRLVDLAGPAPVVHLRDGRALALGGDADPVLAAAVLRLLPDPPGRITVVTGRRSTTLQMTPIRS
ncbi:hypothetical protein LO762_00945 [Actinocorallia sp. API 0066]|uniref:hypothetical protein n=1 Tax=Actinocorallia sp. API 0066 TaxID=2896846 RepID=UPI001E330BF0|nr:hypothetical protein [Actinocorallia sp. API 0066]MCD0447767.1 hypothetical protein [Actinocorallia sp. API 0066]